MSPLTLGPTNWFHRMFATWNRLEPRSRASDFSQGLEARTADALWMLGRQAQFREFAASNGGSPVEVQLTHDMSVVAKVDLGGVTEALSVPMEVRVERERVAWDWRLRVRAGQHFERLVRNWHGDDATELIGWARRHFGIAEPTVDERRELDRSTQRFLSSMAGRAVDGGALLDAWRNVTTVPLPELETITITSAEPAELILGDLLEALVAWYEQLYSQTGRDASRAWRSDRLEYEFGARAAETATAPSDVTAAEWAAPTLSAPSYRNGDLDWHAFDAKNVRRVTWTTRQPQSYVPTRVMFPGMPHPRWWAFENQRVDFAAMDVATTDLVKLALMEFALVYGDDWFLTPLALPLGSLSRITMLRVKDVFGRWTYVHRARDVGVNVPQWEMFTLAHPASADGGGAELLYLPPILAFREESAPVEEIRWVRDEGANMIWAVEHTVPNDMGEPTDGFDLQRERADIIRELSVPTESADAVPQAAALRYRMATYVPENWIPFIPTDAQGLIEGVSSRSVRLRRAQMLTNTSLDDPVPIPSVTRLLDPTDAGSVDWIDEETVGRAGITVVLTRQRARSITGETYVWLGRRVVTGKGEGASGLRFDVVESE